MKKFAKMAVAAAVAGLSVGSAFATPSFSEGLDKGFYQNFENQYRSVAECAAGGCLDASSSDPAGMRRVNSNLANNVKADDLFIGILNVQNVTHGGVDTYNSITGDRFTGYFVQKVLSVDLAAGVGFNAVLKLGTAVDPFGILQTGEMFRLYSNVASFSSGGATYQDDILTAIGGVAGGDATKFWGSFGLGASGEGFAYTTTNLELASSGTDFSTSFYALDVLATGATYSAGELYKINDNVENAVGGGIANTGTNICSPTELAASFTAGSLSAGTAAIGASCMDIVGKSFITGNEAYASGDSDWAFESNDPFKLNRIPEPESLALVGLGLLGLAASRRRKSVK